MELIYMNIFGLVIGTLALGMGISSQSIVSILLGIFAMMINLLLLLKNINSLLGG